MFLVSTKPVTGEFNGKPYHNIMIEFLDESDEAIGFQTYPAVKVKFEVFNNWLLKNNLDRKTVRLLDLDLNYDGSRYNNVKSFEILQNREVKDHVKKKIQALKEAYKYV